MGEWGTHLWRRGEARGEEREAGGVWVRAGACFDGGHAGGLEEVLHRAVGVAKGGGEGGHHLKTEGVRRRWVMWR